MDEAIHLVCHCRDARIMRGGEASKGEVLGLEYDGTPLRMIKLKSHKPATQGRRFTPAPVPVARSIEVMHQLPQSVDPTDFAELKLFEAALASCLILSAGIGPGMRRKG